MCQALHVSAPSWSASALEEAWADRTCPAYITRILSLLANDNESFRVLQYGIFFAAGGHAAIYDYPQASNLHKLAAQVYANGGVVSAVCHGPALLPGIKDNSTGKPLIQGKKVTGFAEKGEVEVSLCCVILLDTYNPDHGEYACMWLRLHAQNMWSTRRYVSLLGDGMQPLIRFEHG